MRYIFGQMGSNVSSPAARVLVIDDDEQASSLIRDLLGDGYQVHTMVSPVGATQMIMAHNIQVAVVDLGLPITEGDRTLPMLRSWGRICDLPMVLICSASSEALKRALLHMPGVMVVSRDHLRESLAPAVARAVASTRADRKGRASDRAGRDEALTSFLKEAAESSRNALRAFRELCDGHEAWARELRALLFSLRARAQTYGLWPIANLTDAIVKTLDGRSDPAKLSERTKSVVAAALAELGRLCIEKASASEMGHRLAPHLSKLDQDRLDRH